MHFRHGVKGQNGGGRSEHTGFVDGRVVAVTVVHVGSVEQVVVGAAAGAVHGKLAEGAGGVGNLVGRTGDAGIQENQLGVVASVHRHVLDRLGRDHAAHIVRSRLDQRQRFSGDFDSDGYFSGLEGGINTTFGGHVDCHSGHHKSFEASLRYGHGVCP